MKHQTESEKPTCHVCDSRELVALPEFELLPRATSDSRPWSSGGKLGHCPSCGCVQKIVDDEYDAECRQIYSSYSIYHQSEGHEQLDFEGTTGSAIRRSERVLRSVIEKISLPLRGRLLDVGCGNGNMLRTCTEHLPSWSLAGHDINEDHCQDVTQIKNVEAFHSGNLEEIPSEFDIISMHHTFEHIVNPVAFLNKLRKKLKPKGTLLINVPDFAKNPFDLIVADHCSHFDLGSLICVLQSAGFEPTLVLNGSEQKDLTVVARKYSGNKANCQLQGEVPSYEIAGKAVRWLSQTLAAGRRVSKNRDFGLFGAAVSSAWLFNEVRDCVEFFVDEDPHKAGQKYLDRVVIRPNEIPNGANIFLPFTYKMAHALKERVAIPSVAFHLPPFSTM